MLETSSKAVGTALIAKLDDRRPETRCAAARVIGVVAKRSEKLRKGVFRELKAEEAIKRRLADPDQRVRAAAKVAVEAFHGDK
jgi:HEAT repeat protein